MTTPEPVTVAAVQAAPVVLDREATVRPDVFQLVVDRRPRPATVFVDPS